MPPSGLAVGAGIGAQEGGWVGLGGGAEGFGEVGFPVGDEPGVG